LIKVIISNLECDKLGAARSTAKAEHQVIPGRNPSMMLRNVVKRSMQSYFTACVIFLEKLHNSVG